MRNMRSVRFVRGCHSNTTQRLGCRPGCPLVQPACHTISLSKSINDRCRGGKYLPVVFVVLQVSRSSYLGVLHFCAIHHLMKRRIPCSCDDVWHDWNKMYLLGWFPVNIDMIMSFTWKFNLLRKPSFWSVKACSFQEVHREKLPLRINLETLSKVYLEIHSRVPSGIASRVLLESFYRNFHRSSYGEFFKGIFENFSGVYLKFSLVVPPRIPPDASTEVASKISPEFFFDNSSWSSCKNFSRNSFENSS